MKTLCSIVLLCAAAVVAPAQSTVTYTITGTLGPVLGGTDCLGLDNMMLSLTASISSKSVPIKTTTVSATYKLPAGSVSVTIGGTNFKNTKPWTVTYILNSTSDNLTFAGAGMSGTTYIINANLKVKSFPPTVLGTTGHPSVFKPSPQTLTSPASFLSYTTTLCTAASRTMSSSKLGLGGSANSQPAAPTR